MKQAARHLRALITQASTGGSVTITRKGEPAAVLLSVSDWAALNEALDVASSISPAALQLIIDARARHHA